MNRLMIILCLAICFSMAGCSGDGGRSLYDTAQFEEKQNNIDHAVSLYKEIVSKYPDSPYAAKAAEQLAKLGKR